MDTSVWSSLAASSSVPYRLFGRSNEATRDKGGRGVREGERSIVESSTIVVTPTSRHADDSPNPPCVGISPQREDQTGAPAQGRRQPRGQHSYSFIMRL